MRQASLSASDPCLPSTTPVIEEEKEWGDVTSAPSLVATSWGFQIDLLAVSQVGDMLELNCRHDDKVISNLLISEEEEDIFPLARAAKPRAPAALSAGDESHRAQQSPFPSIWFCSICANAHISTFLGQLPW